MTPQTLAAAILGAAALIAAFRVLRKRWRWGRAVALAQFALAGLLYAALFPPRLAGPSVPLFVLTPGATPAQMDTLEPGVAAVALPGAPASVRAERMPDLATALRRHPGTGSLRIVGYGLASRDRDAARDLPLRFDAAPLPDGIDEWSAPYAVSAGNVWRVSGRAHGADGGRVELLDPGAGVAASAAIGDDGAFLLHATARLDGETLYRLRAVRADESVVDDVPVALVVRRAEPVRALLLAGGPAPEFKYLRRWAADAGATMTVRIGLSPGITAREGAVAMEPASLREFDVALVDERAWAALGAGEKAGLMDAVRDGLGLILLARGAPSRSTSQQWAELGFQTASLESAPAVTLARDLGLDAQDRYALQRIPLFVESHDAAVVVANDDGQALGWMATWGSGRVGLWSVVDTYRLTLGGRGAHFGTLWARWFETVARASAVSAPQLPRIPRAGERSILCGIAPDARVAADPPVPLLAIPGHPGASACSAWWPRAAGWQRLEQGNRHWPVYVLAATDARARAAAESHAATRAIERTGARAGVEVSRTTALSRWPFAGLWLALAAAAWWWERRRAAPPGPASGLRARSRAGRGGSRPTLAGTAPWPRRC
jgi:hypothetical protein